MRIDKVSNSKFLTILYVYTVQNVWQTLYYFIINNNFYKFCKFDFVKIFSRFFKNFLKYKMCYILN